MEAQLRTYESSSKGAWPTMEPNCMFIPLTVAGRSNHVGGEWHQKRSHPQEAHRQARSGMEKRALGEA